MITQEKIEISSTDERPFKKGSRVAAVGAHPDDIEAMLGHLTARGARLERAGVIDFFGALILTEGTESTKGVETAKNGGRVSETIGGIGSLGVRKANIRVAKLPDGAVDIESASAVIDKYMDEFDITTLMTLGKDGGDREHGDHIVSHEAGLRAAAERSADVLSLNAEGNGLWVVEGDVNVKLGALAFNRSQWDIRLAMESQDLPEGWELIGDFALPPDASREFGHYDQYRQIETYDYLTP